MRRVRTARNRWASDASDVCGVAARAPEGHGGYAGVLALQQAAGNAAVASLLDRGAHRRHAPVQRCGRVDHDECPCSEGARTEVQRVAGTTAGAAAAAACPASPSPVITADTDMTLAGFFDRLDRRKSGVTRPGRLNVETETVRDGDHWRLCVTGVTSTVHVEWWIALGEQEPTKANSTAGNFCHQVLDLHQVNDRRVTAQWYLKSATKAHEMAHYAEWKRAFPADWAKVKQRIEKLRCPASVTVLGSEYPLSKAAATRTLRESAAFRAAVDTSADGSNFPGFWDPPHDDAAMRAIEHAEVDPRIVELCQHAASKGWKAGDGPAHGSTECLICAHYGVT